jgi:hypothetical protein
LPKLDMKRATNNLFTYGLAKTCLVSNLLNYFAKGSN